MTTTNSPIFILVPGHWVGAWAWDEVVPHLAADGSRAAALTLPGCDGSDPDRASRSLDDQAAAIIEAIARNGGSGERPVILVGHSGANAPVSLVLDRHPGLVERVIWVDSGPVAAGSVFAPDLPEEATELPLPDFDVLAQQASLEGLSADALERFRARAVPVPARVLRQRVELANARRRGIPTTLLCCSLPSEQVRELARSGHPMFAEVARLESVDFVDLPTGHWPMWSRPRDLAEVIRAASARA